MTDPKIPDPQGTRGDGGDICGCHNWVCYWHHIGGPWVWRNNHNTQDTPGQSYLSTQSARRAWGESTGRHIALAADRSPPEAGPEASGSQSTGARTLGLTGALVA